MYHSDHSTVEVIAYGLVAFLFIGAGAFNALSKARSRQHAEHFASLGLPYPWLVLCTGYAMQFGGGLMVLFDWHADIGALILIVFTVAAMLAYHHFWRISEPMRRNNAGISNRETVIS